MEISTSGKQATEDSHLTILSVGFPTDHRPLLDIPLSASTPVAYLARGTLAKHFAYWQLHHDGLQTNGAPEHVHQMRVATRRIRAVLGLFRDWFTGDSLLLSEELRWMGSVLGHVRDLDVQSEHFLRHASVLGAPSDVVSPLLECFSSQRLRSFRELTFALDSSRSKSLLSSLVNLILSDAPLSESSDIEGVRLISQRMRRFRKAADSLTRDSDAVDFHRSRIRGKKLRYAVESFVPVYGKPADLLSRRLANLQDILGLLQDVEVASDLLESILHSHPEISSISVMWAGRILQHQSDSKPDFRDFKKAYSLVTSKAWKDLKKKMYETKRD